MATVRLLDGCWGRVDRAAAYAEPVTTSAPPVEPLRRNRLGFTIAAGVLAVAGATALTLAATYPRGHFEWALWGVGLFGLGVVAWLVSGVLALAVRRFSVALLLPPVLFGLMVGVDRTDLPLRARFAAARPAFEDAIAARGEAGPGAPCPDRIGSYQVSSCVTEESITRFTTAGGLLDSVGFAYAPDGVPASTGGGEGSVDYDLLTRSWYTFSQSW